MPMLHQRRRTDIRNETGSIIIMTAFMLIVLMGFTGLALDVGSHYNHKRVLQTAADAGAFQGGHELHRGKMSLITSSARTGTAENGYTHGTDGVVVEVYNPPVSGFYVGDVAAVEVVVGRVVLVDGMVMGREVVVVDTAIVAVVCCVGG